MTEGAAAARWRRWMSCWRGAGRPWRRSSGRRAWRRPSSSCPRRAGCWFRCRGAYAAGVAREALGLGRHVFLYSDNVSLDDEIALKRAALAKGLLVMGPDCGTAIIGGVGLGFANRVRRGRRRAGGRVGHRLAGDYQPHCTTLGAGVSHAIGTGGRDLKREVGAVTARQGAGPAGARPRHRSDRAGLQAARAGSGHAASGAPRGRPANRSWWTSSATRRRAGQLAGLTLCREPARGGRAWRAAA